MDNQTDRGTSEPNVVDIERMHDEIVKTRAKPGVTIIGELTPFNAHLLHMAVGICGEAGELIDAIKKSAIYCKPLDIGNVIEELGDLEFYMKGIRQALEISREETVIANVVKLQKRYPSQNYSNTDAIERKDK